MTEINSAMSIVRKWRNQYGSGFLNTRISQQISLPSCVRSGLGKSKIMHAMLTEDQFNTLVAPREYLWWDVADKRMLSLESVVEGILTKGDLEDVRQLLDTIGIQKVREIFEQQIRKERCNYRPPTINYFSLYFAHHA